MAEVKSQTKMPDSIKVGPHSYAIFRKSSSEIGRKNLGHCDTAKLEIWILQRIKKSKAQETLLHEILHACTHPLMVQGGYHADEEFVTEVAPPLLHVLQENPELISYLTS